MYIYFICLNLKNQRLLKTCHILQGQYESQFCSKMTKTRLANLKHKNGVQQVSSSVHNDLLSWLRLLVSFLSFLPEKNFSQLKSMFIVHTGWSDLAIICNFRKSYTFLLVRYIYRRSIPKNRQILPHTHSSHAWQSLHFQKNNILCLKICRILSFI